MNPHVTETRLKKLAEEQRAQYNHSFIVPKAKKSKDYGDEFEPKRLKVWEKIFLFTTVVFILLLCTKLFQYK